MGFIVYRVSLTYICKMAKKLNILNRLNKIVKMKNEEVNEEELKDLNTEENTESTETVAEEIIEKTEAELLQEEKAALNDKFLRLYSEFDNFRKRTAKEKIDLIKSAGEGVIKDMLPIVDDFKRAIVHNAEVTDEVALKEGFQLIFNKFYKTLETKGLKSVDSKGELFNADIHEALTKIPAPEESLKGKVVDVIEEGYYLGDKIIRFPKVVVGE